MTTRAIVLGAASWIAAVTALSGHAAGPAQTSAAGPLPRTAAGAPPEAAFVSEYCVTCHNERLKTGGLVLDPAAVADVGADAATWEKVVRKVRTGMMPPSGVKRPERAALDAFAAGLEARLDRANPPGAHPDTPALHRMNRTEYANAVRDLLEVTVDVRSLLPADDSSEGFDNLAEALSVSPSLVQGYVAAAMKISRLAVGDRSASPAQITYSVAPQLSQSRHLDGLPIGTRGGFRVTHTFPLDAEYEFTLGGNPGAAGGAAIDITLDGEPVTVPNPRSFKRVVTAGPHTITVALVDRTRGAGIDDTFSDFRVDAAFRPAGAVGTLTINGPFTPSGTGDTPSRRRIFACQPAGPADEAACARRIVSGIARRAYRGSLAEDDMTTLMAFYEQGRREGGFETGVQQALARVLVAPKFLFRWEEDPVKVAPGTVYRLSDLALASRLSFFLWSSLPDDELLELAAKGRLRNPQTLERQVRRMLADPKSSALIENFAGQWLFLRELATIQTDAKGFDDNLRRAFRRETELLVETIVREDRSLVDLLDAPYTFVDERLARHYGIPGVFGSHFRRVELDPNGPRRGLLGHGSMLTVTSVSTRTSPVVRGKWVLENLLGTPVPAPPPGVEVNLDPDPNAPAPTTLRQRLEQHRTNPVCAACHRIMDPMGFALENFDLVGAWRDKEAGFPIDSSGQLADGTPITGPGDLRQALLSRSDAFVTAVTEKLLIYALGRPVHAEDMSAVRTITRRAAAANNRFSTLVLGIVESAPFQLRVKKGQGS